MRRRTIIGVLLIAVTGLTIAFFATSREFSIEYHRRKYREARRWIDGTNVTVSDRVTHVWNEGLGRRSWYYRQALDHQYALTRLGYVEDRSFTISNRLPVEIVGRVWANRRAFEVLDVSGGTNTIQVIATKKDMPAVEKLIREIDVPETGK